MPTVGIVLGGLTITGFAEAASDVTSGNTGSSSTTVAIIGGCAIILVCIIGGFFTLYTNRRTGASPPAADGDEIGLGRRVTTVEQNVSNMREDIHEHDERLSQIDGRVGPLAERVDVKFTEVYRRLANLEKRQDRQ